MFLSNQVHLMMSAKDKSKHRNNNRNNNKMDLIIYKQFHKYK